MCQWDVSTQNDDLMIYLELHTSLNYKILTYIALFQFCQSFQTYHKGNPLSKIASDQHKYALSRTKEKTYLQKDLEWHMHTPLEPSHYIIWIFVESLCIILWIPSRCYLCSGYANHVEMRRDWTTTECCYSWQKNRISIGEGIPID